MESSFNFVQEREFQPKTFATREGKEVFLQWFGSRDNHSLLIPSSFCRGLENTLKINRFKIEGNLKSSEDIKVLKDFFSNQNSQQILGFEGSVEYPVTIESQELRTSIRSMEFFDRLNTEGTLTNLESPDD